MYRKVYFILFPLLLIYYYYLSPLGIVSGDGGEIATMAMNGGLTHPPGYNIILWFYNIFGNLFVSLGFTPAFGMALFNVFVLLFSFIFIYKALKNKGIYFLYIVIIYYATIPFFVYNGLTIEVYILSIFISSFIIYAISIENIVLAFYLFGLGLAHHRSFVGLVPLFVYLFYKNKNLMKWNMLFFFIGITPILYNIIIWQQGHLPSYNAHNIISYLMGQDYHRYFQGVDTVKAILYLLGRVLGIIGGAIFFLLLPVRFDKWKDWKEFLFVFCGFLFLPFLILPSYSFLSIQSAEIFFIPLLIVLIYYLPYRYLKWNISYLLIFFIIFNILHLHSLKDGKRYVEQIAYKIIGKGCNIETNKEEILYPLFYYAYIEGKGIIKAKDGYNRYKTHEGQYDTILPPININYNLTNGYTFMDSVVWIETHKNIKEERFIHSPFMFAMAMNSSAINDTLIPYLHIFLEEKPPVLPLYIKAGYLFGNKKEYKKASLYLYEVAKRKRNNAILWADAGVYALFSCDTIKAINIWREGLRYNRDNKLLNKYILGIKDAL